jgi:hypothetical protein
VGVAGCSSSSCHNGNDPERIKLSEFSIWSAQDKHQRAHAALYSQRARQMAVSLAPTNPDKKPIEAHKDKRCLRCHATGDDFDENGRTLNADERFYMGDGVGCESCHGPAEKWIGEHFRESFKKKSAAEKAEYGMRDLKPLSARVALCSSCHVGNKDKEVDHDLIAAGHPRMNFEFSGFHSIYPKHWLPSVDTDNYPDFESRAWVLGQAMTATSALELLKARASRVKPDAENKWPEFSEYGCFNCHKTLGVRNPHAEWPRFALQMPRRPLGSRPLSNWYYGMVSDPAGPVGKIEGLAELRKVMETAYPDTGKVTAEANKAIAALRKAMVDLDKGPGKKTPAMPIADVRRRFNDLLTDGLKPIGVEQYTRADVMEWDEAAQLYLALAALYADLAARDKAFADPQRKKELQEMAHWLRAAFRKDYDSPYDYPWEPKNMRLKDLLKKMQSIQGS